MATSITLYVVLPILFLFVVPGKSRPRVLVLASVYFTAALIAHLCVPLATGIARWERSLISSG